MLYSAPPKPRSASVRRYKNRVDQDLQDEMRPRTSSMPTKNTWRKPQLLGPPPWSGEYTDDLFVRDSDDIPYSNETDNCGQCSPTAAYRMRSFTTTSKGLVNRGDSLVTNYSWISPNNSVSDYPSGSNSTSSLTSAQAYKVLVLGAPSVGKAAIIQQMMTSEYMGWKSTESYEGDVGSKYVSVLLDKEETMLDVTKIQGTESLPSGVDYDAYVLVFGIDDKQSFNDAVDFLYRFRKEDVHNCLVVLVANKVDLVRNRVITTEEAKGIASAYDCKYIESSTILNHHLDELLVCLVSEIRSRQRKSRSSHEKTPQKSRSPVSPKHLFNKLFRRGSISKSYENLAED
ncbi:GTP-binding protein GEM-like [Octopus vulgaris]|uniref:GTP-binding protein GEM-like n=1 Tax=Octopus vulgaris TaxID=6645 RepID=A0AA36BNM8_OCTVU|nr:GTP-binding protein GEM-like [Octopus vulgaris]